MQRRVARRVFGKCKRVAADGEQVLERDGITVELVQLVREVREGDADLRDQVSQVRVGLAHEHLDLAQLQDDVE